MVVVSLAGMAVIAILWRTDDEPVDEQALRELDCMVERLGG